MDGEHLHRIFAKVIDTSFAYTNAFNQYGSCSPQATAAHDAYTEAMAYYKNQVDLAASTSTRWEILCAQHPHSQECRIYDV